MATAKAVGIGTTAVAATGVVGYGVSQVVGSSNEETPNSNPQVQETTQVKITNRQKITDSKFELPATDKGGCKERLDAFFVEVNQDYKKLVKECSEKTTLKGRANAFSFNNRIRNPKEFSSIETKLGNLSKLKEKYDAANKETSRKIETFCHQAGKISIQEFSSVEEVENSWAKYLEICSTSQPKNFWAI